MSFRETLGSGSVESRHGRPSIDAFDNVFTRLGAEQQRSQFDGELNNSRVHRREPFSGEAGFFGGVETKPGNVFLYPNTNRLNSPMSRAPNISGRDHAPAARGFGSAQPFSGEWAFDGGVNARHGRVSDGILNNPFTTDGFHGSVNTQRGRVVDGILNNPFTIQEARLSGKRYISENSSIDELDKAFRDKYMPHKRPCYAHTLPGCPETNKRLLEEYGKNGQFRSPPNFFANIPLYPNVSTSPGASASRIQDSDDTDLPNLGTLSLTHSDRFYSARNAHRS